MHCEDDNEHVISRNGLLFRMAHLRHVLAARSSIRAEGPTYSMLEAKPPDVNAKKEQA